MIKGFNDLLVSCLELISTATSALLIITQRHAVSCHALNPYILYRRILNFDLAPVEIGRRTTQTGKTRILGLRRLATNGKLRELTRHPDSKYLYSPLLSARLFGISFWPVSFLLVFRRQMLYHVQPKDFSWASE